MALRKLDLFQPWMALRCIDWSLVYCPYLAPYSTAIHPLSLKPLFPRNTAAVAGGSSQQKHQTANGWFVLANLVT
jgi:hypothetical protein